MLKGNDVGKCLAEIKQLFTIQADPKLLRFVNFSKSLKKPIALLGKDRIHDLIINFAIPLFVDIQNFPSSSGKIP